MSNQDRDGRLEDVALYALGVLPPREAAQLAELVERDPAVRAEYEELRLAADALALTAEEPVDSKRSARMRERLLARVRADGVSPLRPRLTSVPTSVWAAGLAAAAAFVFGVVTIAQDLTLRGNLAAAERRVSALQAQVRQSERSNEQRRRILADLVAPDSRRYAVPNGSVIVRGPRLYLALALPAPPRGHVYQAWTQPKGSDTMLPSITFEAGGNGYTIVALPIDAERVAAVAVSVEPAGGSKAPTTTPRFVRPLG